MEESGTEGKEGPKRAIERQCASLSMHACMHGKRRGRAKINACNPGNYTNAANMGPVEDGRHKWRGRDEVRAVHTSNILFVKSSDMLHQHSDALAIGPDQNWGREPPAVRGFQTTHRERRVGRAALGPTSTCTRPKLNVRFRPCSSCLQGERCPLTDAAVQPSPSTLRA